MTILLVQTFLLLLGAFLLGAALACFVRRTLAGRMADDAVLAGGATAAAVTGAAGVGDADRFGRALTGGVDAPPFAPTGPVVEVQPRPPVRVTPLIEDVEPPEATAPAAPPEPEPEPAPPPPAPESEEPSAGESYRQVAGAAAAGAAAAAAAGLLSHGASEGDAAEDAVPETPVSEDAATEPEAAFASEEEPSADETPPADERSYTEIAASQATGLAAAAAAAGVAAAAADESEEGEEEQPAAPVEPVEGDGVVPEAAAAVSGDDFTRIHSIDAALRDRLHGLGMARFADIGGWSATDVLRFTQALGVAPGRIEQENWVGQAQVIAGGGVTDYPRWRGEADAPRAAPASDGELLSRIIGIDPESERVLRENGVGTLADIAAWTEDDVASFEHLLDAPGRIGRENWVDQARFLTRGSTGVAGAIEDIAAPAAGIAAGVAAVGVLASQDEGAEAEAPAAQAAGSEEPSEDCVPPPAAAAGSRAEGYTGLRSVRSEALVGDLSLAPAGSVDDLKRIRGIGVLIEKKLQSLGITSYEQMANWTGDDVARISEVLDFKGRIERENWIEQARILASGGQTEFSRRVDKGEA